MSETITHLFQPGGMSLTRCGLDVRVSESFGVFASIGGRPHHVKEAFEPLDRICNDCEEAKRFRVAEKVSWDAYHDPEGGTAVYLEPQENGSGEEYFYDWDTLRNHVLHHVHHSKMTLAEFYDEAPGHAWSTRVCVGIFSCLENAQGAADASIDAACDELHEHARDALTTEAERALGRSILEWDRRWGKDVKTYYSSDKVAVILGPSFWHDTVAKLDFADEESANA